MLIPLSNEVIFKKAFSDPFVLQGFVKDIVGIDFIPGRVETEKRFRPSVGPIDVRFDIFAESQDKRVVVEIQKVDYDYNFDRFLNYFCTAIIELQKNSKSYKIEKTVYCIVVITSNYVLQTEMIKDDYLVVDLNPRNSENIQRKIYGHKLIFLNPSYRNSHTNASISEWLKFITASMKECEPSDIKTKNSFIQRAVSLIDENCVSPEERSLMFEESGRKIVQEAAYEKKIKEGKNEREIEIATEMIKNGESDEKIKKYTALEDEKIFELRQQLNIFQ